MSIAEIRNGHEKKYYWLFIIITSFGLYLTTFVNYLLFHSLVELFSIIVAASVFIITWNSIKYIKNPYLIMIGISYLFIAILDLLHTLAYQGMPIFTDYDYYANQLWIAARFLESSTLLVAFYLLYAKKNVKAGLLFAVFFIITSLLIASIFYWKIFPVCFVAGKGLTSFKVYSEYVICAILVASIVLLVRSKNQFADSVYKLLLLSLAYTIISELAFTFYIDNYGVLNIVGHYFKLFSFMMIYRAIISTGITEPYSLIFNELNQARQIAEQVKKDLQKVNDELELRVTERTMELAKTLQDLQVETAERLQAMEALRDKEQMIIHQSRQAAMGEMIGNIAHQWRQPLNALGLFTQRLGLFYDTPGFNKEFLDTSIAKSMEIIQHMSKTIDDFRDYFKPDKEKSDFNVDEAIKNTLSLLEGSFQNPKIGIVIETKDNPVINGFHNEFAQVLLNILINARDVFIERQIVDARVIITSCSENGCAVVIVADNAGGIPEEIIDKVFDPYFTTKGLQHGTGVGLFMSKTIIEKNMGGKLTVRNTDTGAEFRIEV